ncbi:MAG: T9SS type A sorting domain-containing protein [Bacteroidota bacterium]
MKELLALISFSFFTAFCSYSQGIQWEKSYGGSGADYANSIIQTLDGCYIIAGGSSSNDGDITNHIGNYDYWVVKINSLGTIQWQKSFGGSSDDFATSIQQTSDGGYIVAGNSNSSDGDVTGNHGNNDYWLVKLDTGGTLQWEKSFGGSFDEICSNIRQTQDKGYVLVGQSYSNDGDVTMHYGVSGDTADIWIVKLDSVGSIQWQKTYGGTSVDGAGSVIQTSDGGYIVGGGTTSTFGDFTGNHGNIDCLVFKLDSVGTIQWQHEYGGNLDEKMGSVLIKTNDGGYIFPGLTNSNDGDVSGNHGGIGSDGWVVKIDSLGAIVWQKCLGGTSIDGLGTIQQTIERGYILAGFTVSNDGDVSGHHGAHNDYWTVKIDSAGSIQWQKCLGGSMTDYGAHILQSTDLGYIVAGYSDSNDGDVTGNHLDYDYWVVKLSPSLGVNENYFQNKISIYPNPNSGKFILYSNKNLSNIKVFDIMGRVIWQTGVTQSNTFNIDIMNYAKGVYYVRSVNEDGEIEMQKLIKE